MPDYIRYGMPETFDVVVIGAGATGAGVARDCAMRGLKTLVLDRGPAARGTTSASTHLIHGGLRYLLYDRLTTHATCLDSGHIVRAARPLLRRLPILWPVYRGHARGLETVEALLEAYDGFQKMKEGRRHLRLSAEETLRLVPSLKADGLRGALAFDEWWVDPIALVEQNLASARRHGAEARLEAPVERFLLSSGKVQGVAVAGRDVHAKMVINAAGPWVDRVARLAGASIPLRLQKGSHLAYRRRLAPVGLLLEADGGRRYVFVVPSEQGTLVGPTDLPAGDDPDAAFTSNEEIRFLLETATSYLPDFPRRYDATMIGVRPILGQRGDESLLSRQYEVIDHGSRDGIDGFLTIAGGKMSDYRAMAEAVTDSACARLGRPMPCRTHRETLAGEALENIPCFPPPNRALKSLLGGRPRLRQLHSLSCLAAAFARHWLRKAAGTPNLATAEQFRDHFA